VVVVVVVNTLSRVVIFSTRIFNPCVDRSSQAWPKIRQTKEQEAKFKLFRRGRGLLAQPQVFCVNDKLLSTDEVWRLWRRLGADLV